MKTQQDKILHLLQAYHTVNSWDLTYVHGIKQAPTRIQELQEQGYHIEASKPLPNRSVDYTIHNDTTPEAYTWDFSTGTARRVLVIAAPSQEGLL